MSKKNQQLFQKNGYCVVKSAVSFELIDFITQYALFDEMQDFQAEGEKNQVPDAHSKYGDPAMETLLARLHKIMEENTGLALYPTYSYYRIYRNGNELKKHIDRPACEISCTLCFNYSYDDEEYQWPIFMDGNPVSLKPGDLVIYRGMELEHWREPFDIDKENSWHVQGFFHYVDKNGPYTDHKFDKRESIGYLPESKTGKSSKSYIEYLK